MRMRAKRELSKRDKDEGKSEIQPTSTKNPSVISGFFLILAGSLVFSIFLSNDQFLLGILAGAGFMILGMSRISKASAAKSRKESLIN